MLNTKELLRNAINEGAEVYQPVYGHSEWDTKASRPCVDRLPEIKKIYDALSKELNRPLRVLDLGCNLGFFSFHLAKWGGGDWR